MPVGVDALVETESARMPLCPGTRLILFGLIVRLKPFAGGETVPRTRTVPVKPELARLMLELAEPPAMKLVGLMFELLMLKSPVTLTTTCVV